MKDTQNIIIEQFKDRKLLFHYLYTHMKKNILRNKTTVQSIYITVILYWLIFVVFYIANP